MITGTSLPEDDVARAGLLDRVELPWHITLGASARDAWVHNPLNEAVDAVSTFWANNPELRAPLVSGFSDGAIAPNEVLDAGAADALVDPKTLNEQHSQSLGLSFDRPMRQGAVDIMVRRKREEVTRNAYMNRAPDGLAYGIANFATQVAVSATDPLNIASAFVPVVSEARFGLWAARYGKTAARFGKGAVEGTVGALAVEPIVYGTEKYLQGDYDLMDSFMNVAVGSVLGGGLHAGLGAISDRFARLAPETRESALRAGVAQMAEGRDVDVGHVIVSDPIYREASYLPIVNEREFALLSEDAQVRDRLAETEGKLKALAPDNPNALDLSARLRAVEDQLKNPDLAVEERRALSTRRDEILTDTTPEKLREQAAPTEQRRILNNEMAAIQRRAAEIKTERERIAADRSLAPPVLPPDAAQAFATLRQASVDPGAQPRALMAQGEAARAPLRAEADLIARAANDHARTQSESYARGETVSSAASPEAAANAARIVKEGLGDDIAVELDEAMARLADYERQGILSPEQMAEAEGARELIKLARKNGKAAEAAARCLLLHP